MPAVSRSPMEVSPAWLQASVLTFLFGFAVLGYLAIRVYEDHPPIPRRVVTESDRIVFTGDDVRSGQELFLTFGLMQYGSIYGHGAYLGPDFTADYLHREAEELLRLFGGDAAAAARMREELRANRYDAKTDVLTWSDERAKAFEAIREHYEQEVLNRQKSGGGGLGPHAVADPDQSRRIVAFMAWTAWTAAARRPGRPHSYTNNWPPEPLVGNDLTSEAVVWSTLSIIALLGGTGLLLALFGRYSNSLGWHSGEPGMLRFRPSNEVGLTPAQRITAWYFFIVSVLFLLQTLLGGATAHYHAETGGFFGYDLAQLLPYNLARTWHLQLALFFVVASYLAAGIFLAPLIAGEEPRGQRLLTMGLLGALVVVVLGSLAGEAASYKGWLKGDSRSIVGAQGWEYLDLGRLWQVLLVAGLALWCLILFRGLSSKLRAESRGNLPHLFFYSALSIPAFYAVGLLSHSRSDFAVADFWRFWVVHLWVEDFLELFTTIMVAYMFVLLGVVPTKTATRVVYLDVLLYSTGGVIGTMHHLYFSGTPAVHMALGAFFSAAEVIPLTFLTVEAWSFMQMGSRTRVVGGESQFPHRFAVLFLASVGFWNFLGAGVFGFLINLPVVSYYEIGTHLTANHGHAAMMGVYGMLAIALIVFCLRYLLRPEDWSDRLVGFSFWSLNLGLAWMVFINLFPLGILQLADVVTNGYWHARSLEFFEKHAYIEWLRLPGDVVFIAGVVPLVYLTAKSVLRPAPISTSPSPTLGGQQSPLYFVEAVGSQL
jgi:nitric oxide reductase subunit B